VHVCLMPHDISFMLVVELGGMDVWLKSLSPKQDRVRDGWSWIMQLCRPPAEVLRMSGFFEIV